MNKEMYYKEIKELFSDCSDEVIAFIIEAFEYSFKHDEKYSKRDFEMLCSLKQYNPNFKIMISDEPSSFTPSTITIEKGKKNYSVFFHELTHAFHYYQTGNLTPKEFEIQINRLISSKDFLSSCIDIIKFCNERRIKLIIETSASIEKEQIIKSFNYINLKNDNKKPDIMLNLQSINENNSKLYLELECIDSVLDIIDALVGGKSYSKGLCFIKNNNELATKSMKSPGHGEEYYNSSSHHCFAEILADYAAIMKSEFKDYYFKLLEILLGEELMILLDTSYEKLVEGPLKNLNINYDEIKGELIDGENNSFKR